jgi:hypothetical protein
MAQKQRAAAAGQNKTTAGISPQAKALRQVRNAAPSQRLVAAWRLTGAATSTSAFGAWDSGPVDIFAKAAGFATGKDSPYNNWLNSDSKPAFTVYPTSIGIFLGEALGNTTYPIKSVLAEHCYFELKMGSGSSPVRQQVATMPSGLGVETRYATADSTGADKRINETFGPSSPMQLYRLPPEIVFSETEQIRGFLHIDPLALSDLKTALTAYTLPTRGALIEVVVYGEAKLKVGVTR